MNCADHMFEKYVPITQSIKMSSIYCETFISNLWTSFEQNELNVPNKPMRRF